MRDDQPKQPNPKPIPKVGVRQSIAAAADDLIRAALPNHNGSVVIPVEAWVEFKAVVEANRR